MTVRNFAGRPLRSAFTIIAIAFAVLMVVLGLFWRDAIYRMIEIQFNLVERGWLYGLSKIPSVSDAS